MRVFFGAAFLGGVVIVARHFSDQQEFVRLARQAQPSWFLAAIVLQALTYLAQGEIWRKIGRMDGQRLSLWTVYKLALIKLFVDQALPSAGFSGALAVARILGHHALRRASICAAVVVGLTSFFFAYVLSLIGALLLLFFSGRATTVILIPSVIYMVLVAILAVGMVALAGRDVSRHLGRVGRIFVVHNALRAMRDADPHLVRDARLQTIATLYQLLTFLLDAVTLWALLRSLGVSANPGHVFATFMIANLVRTVGIVPGGLGTFEATAVLMLRMDGVSVAAALSATVLFRVTTFLLPMAPGLWFSRHLTRHQGLRSG